MKKFAAVLMMVSGLLFAASSQAKEMKPDEVANLYFKAFVNMDTASLKKLNAYNLPVMGKDKAIKDEDLRTHLTETPAGLVQSLEEDIPEERTKVIHESFLAYLQTVHSVIISTQCKAKPAKVASKSGSIQASVEFDCAVIKLNPEHQLTEDRFKKIPAEDLVKFFQAATAAIKAAKPTETIQLSFDLVGKKTKRGTFWEMIDLGQFYAKTLLLTGFFVE